MKTILAIVGPTATGKTRLAIEINKVVNGRDRSLQKNSTDGLISVDSRQVYRGMDIGTGKDAKIFGTDLVKPNKLFNVSDFAKIVKPKIEKLWQENVLPILVGGTGLYLKAIIDEIETMDIPPDEKLRKKYEKYSVKELQRLAISLDPRLRGDDTNPKGMNNSDWNNPRRLIRKIEIAEFNENPKTRKSENPKIARSQNPKNQKNNFQINKLLMIGITAPLSQLTKNIEKRVQERLDSGLLEEIKKLVREYGWNEVLKNTIAYKEWENYFLQKSTFQECVLKWTKDEIDYAKRQMTWFKKDARIVWIEKNYLEESLKIIEERKLCSQNLYSS